MAMFALIHGAGDVGWYWHLVKAELQASGHHSVAPDLPIDVDAAGLDTYADVVVDAIGSRPDVVVVAQSFGGYVVRDRLGITPDELDGGHCLALSRPRELAALLRGYLG